MCKINNCNYKYYNVKKYYHVLLPFFVINITYKLY